jgi:hypothetical protein
MASRNVLCQINLPLRLKKVYEPCGLDEGLALSGRKFGVDGNTALQVFLSGSQPEACLMTRAIATSQVVADKCASQANSRGFSTSRQTFVQSVNLCKFKVSTLLNPYGMGTNPSSQLPGGRGGLGHLLLHSSMVVYPASCLDARTLLTQVAHTCTNPAFLALRAHSKQRCALLEERIA